MGGNHRAELTFPESDIAFSFFLDKIIYQVYSPIWRSDAHDSEDRDEANGIMA